MKEKTMEMGILRDVFRSDPVSALILLCITFHESGIDAPQDWGYSERIITFGRNGGTRTYAAGFRLFRVAHGLIPSHNLPHLNKVALPGRHGGISLA
jgi:hypothetical protein